MEKRAYESIPVNLQVDFFYDKGISHAKNAGSLGFNFSNSYSLFQFSNDVLR